MFQPVVTLLMLTSITVHAVLGCCWHHAHPEPDSPVSALVETHAHIHLGDAGHDHQHHHCHHPGDSSGHPFECPGNSCCEELTCTYVVSPPAKLPLPEMEQLGGMPGLVGTMGSLPGSVLLADRRFGEEAPPLSGHSAVRDLTQVWLL
jgi:hypothetical protein